MADPMTLQDRPADAPASLDAFARRLQDMAPGLPKRLRQCADHVGRNLDRVAVSTVADLAEGAGVPPSAVMRFCQIMGFSGFSEMQRLFREDYGGARPDYATRLRALREGAGSSPGALLAEFIDAGRASLERLATQANETAMETATHRLAAGRMIHLAGFRRAYPVASYMAYALERMGVAAMLHSGAGHLDQSQAISADDAVLAITFAPYSAETVDLVALAQKRGARIVALTDGVASPVALAGVTVLTVEEVDFGAFRSLSATLAVAMALAVAIGTRRGTV
ncbi:MurR/RpiR family transcriptional regulator [Acidimangrovimonas sediminis]|uniref:MurR/RpiR family transcriptional regulator n=2 Tax=Albidovulum sediminis TaxID=3066345 RepID=A0ABT2NIN3_9RHOB|nr:MurR/RpiR family transcriptional regulator [Defluviimonas sediminis]